MKKYLLITLVFTFVLAIYAENKNIGDPRTPVAKTDGAWSKSDNDAPAGTNVQTIADGITYYSTADGIFITLPKATSNVKLFALTGEVVWSGNLVQGRFFIPTRQGIYFLRINNKSYKVVCK